MTRRTTILININSLTIVTTDTDIYTSDSRTIPTKLLPKYESVRIWISMSRRYWISNERIMT